MKVSTHDPDLSDSTVSPSSSNLLILVPSIQLSSNEFHKTTDKSLMFYAKIRELLPGKILKMTNKTNKESEETNLWSNKFLQHPFTKYCLKHDVHYSDYNVYMSCYKKIPLIILFTCCRMWCDHDILQIRLVSDSGATESNWNAVSVHKSTQHIAKLCF